MSGVFSLMVWVIFVFCVFNKRYNQMEGVVVGMFGFYIFMQDNLMILILECYDGVFLLIWYLINSSVNRDKQLLLLCILYGDIF